VLQLQPCQDGDQANHKDKLFLKQLQITQNSNLNLLPVPQCLNNQDSEVNIEVLLMDSLFLKQLQTIQSLKTPSPLEQLLEINQDSVLHTGVKISQHLSQTNP